MGPGARLILACALAQARLGLVQDLGFRRWRHARDGARLDAQGAAARQRWTLIATHGDGPYVPTLAAAALVRKLAAGAPLAAGARACIGLLTLDDFAREAVGLHITWRSHQG
jgi:hypothetical protein